MTSGTYPRMTATPMPPATSHTATRSPSTVTVHGLRSVPSECEAFMGEQGASGPGICKPRGNVQDRNPHYKPTTEGAAKAWRELGAVVGALTEPNIRAQLPWGRNKTRRWLDYFKAKGAIPRCESGERRSA